MTNECIRRFEIIYAEILVRKQSVESSKVETFVSRSELNSRRFENVIFVIAFLSNENHGRVKKYSFMTELINTR